jgi:hypothetical protein
MSWAFVPRVVAEEAGSNPARPAPESAGPEYRDATEAQQLNLLRKLLGVESPKTAAPAEPSAVAQPQESVPPTLQPAAATTPKSIPKPVAKPAAPKAAKPKAAPKPQPKAQAARTREDTTPQPSSTTTTGTAPAEHGSTTTTPEPTALEPSTATTEAPVAVEETAPAKKSSVAESAISEKDLPPVGTILSAANAERWTHLLTPSLRWTLQRGGRMQVVAPQRIEEEPPRAAATEQFHQQVELSSDKKSLVNYVAGTPFPDVTASDPDAAVKIIFNFENRQQFDDVDGRNFGCITGRINRNDGVEVERNYRIGHFRRLYYVGRLIVDPKPTWPTPERIRMRETLSPINEPFDFKGAGFSYSRYLDPARQDDSWLYYPQTKRVRRLSTAQRSEGVFGQDVDLDSYAGFAGNPAWFDWQLLGKKTLLASFHAIHEPVQWLAKPADFMFDDAWEPRETYILAARSRLPGYNFSLRVIYVDAESWHIPYTEVYDNDGQLWRAYIQQWKAGSNKPMPYNKEAVYPFKTTFIQALTVFDMQQEHTTRCEFPASDAPREEMWYYWWGDKGGSQPEDFDVANFINAGR